MDENKYMRYSLNTLEKWLSKAETEYYEETIKPQGSWGDGMRLSKLPTLSRWCKLHDKVIALEEAIAYKNNL